LFCQTSGKETSVFNFCCWSWPWSHRMNYELMFCCPWMSGMLSKSVYNLNCILCRWNSVFISFGTVVLITHSLWEKLLWLTNASLVNLSLEHNSLISEGLTVQYHAFMISVCFWCICYVLLTFLASAYFSGAREYTCEVITHSGVISSVFVGHRWYIELCVDLEQW
jgi:hypothetical protein